MNSAVSQPEPAAGIAPFLDGIDSCPGEPNPNQEHGGAEDGEPLQRHDSTTSIEALGDCVSELAAQLSGLMETQSTTLTEVRQLKAHERVLEDLQNQCQRYREQFFDREVLGPVLLGLIGLADRARSDIARLRKSAVGQTKGATSLALIQFLEMRQADLTEIETLLAGLGAESFQHAGDSFNASLQTCRGRVAASKRACQGYVAERLLPGYRRNDRTVRRELVKVYVTNDVNNGEQS